MKIIKNMANLWWNAPGFPSVLKCAVVALVMMRYERETRVCSSINITNLGYWDHNETTEDEVG